VREANAWVQIAALALTAVSAFSKGGDGGLGAYLNNIRELSQENIKLTQQVLLSVAQVHAKLAELPDRMRTVFIEVKGYELAQETQQALNLLTQVEGNVAANGRLRSSDKEKCEDILKICARLTGARAAPYGIGGTAASCIAVTGAIDARAHWFLGREREFKRWVGNAYLPWFDAILGGGESSLQRSFFDEGARLQSMTAALLSRLPEAQRTAMQAQWQEIATSEPAQRSSEFSLACGTYHVQTGERRGPCVRKDCDHLIALRSPLSFSSMSTGQDRLDHILKANELTTAEAQTIPDSEYAQSRAMSLLRRDIDSPRPEVRNCYCVDWAEIPIYTPASAVELVGWFETSQSEGMPTISLTTKVQPTSLACPTVAAQGRVADVTAQSKVIDGYLNPVRLTIDDLKSTELTNYNAQRAIVFSIYKLLDATRSSRNAFLRYAS
jgi:hypothetical protein